MWIAITIQLKYEVYMKHLYVRCLILRYCSAHVRSWGRCWDCEGLTSYRDEIEATCSTRSWNPGVATKSLHSCLWGYICPLPLSLSLWLPTCYIFPSWCLCHLLHETVEPADLGLLLPMTWAASVLTLSAG